MKFLRTLLALTLAFACIPAARATDLTITAASVVPGARAKIDHGTAGASITQGQLLYYDSSAGTYKLADANASATTANVVGYAANAASAGQPLSIVTEDDDMTVGATLSMSAPVYVLSATAGGIAPSADLTTGWYPMVVLIAKSTTKASFKIVRGSAACAMLHLDLPASRIAMAPTGIIHQSRYRREDTEPALALAA
ncbi:hypothetical protein [Prosthecobacter sp.]|uniref:hypothetical protein n=1 Tax=Prosthecobacter sp. TaxID=1965333 RepID=UPI00378344FB